nr:hypothetical protein CFP56_56956 [Quercus suber]
MSEKQHRAGESEVGEKIQEKQLCLRLLVRCAVSCLATLNGQQSHERQTQNACQQGSGSLVNNTGDTYSVHRRIYAHAQNLAVGDASTLLVCGVVVSTSLSPQTGRSRAEWPVLSCSLRLMLLRMVDALHDRMMLYLQVFVRASHTLRGLAGQSTSWISPELARYPGYRSDCEEHHIEVFRGDNSKVFLHRSMPGHV